MFCVALDEWRKWVGLGCSSPQNLKCLLYMLLSFIQLFNIVILPIVAPPNNLFLCTPPTDITFNFQVIFYRLNGPFANPLITSCTSTLNVPIVSPKTFWDRLLNTYDYAYTYSLHWWHDRKATEIGRTYFGEDAPDAHTLMNQISLVFVNSHFTFDLPRPWVTNLIEIGGIHVTDPKPLPKVSKITILLIIDESSLFLQKEKYNIKK